MAIGAALAAVLTFVEVSLEPLLLSTYKLEKPAINTKPQAENGVVPRLSCLHTHMHLCVHGRSLCELCSCVSLSEGMRIDTLAYVLQEACVSLHVCKGEGACKQLCTCVTCESCQHVGACARVGCIKWV